MNAVQYLLEMRKRAADRRAVWLVVGTSSLLWTAAAILVLANGRDDSKDRYPQTQASWFREFAPAESRTRQQR